MGSDWRIHHGGGVDGATAQRVAELVAEDEARWSRFSPTSDVARITRGAGGPVPVAPETIELVTAAIGWSERTGGVFEPLVGGDLGRWGYARSLDRGAQAPASPPVTTSGSDGAIVVDREAGTVGIPAGSELDLGGIGKSWAAVRAGALLVELVDDERLIVDAGGDLAILRGEHEIATAAGRILALAGTGVATSSTERRAWTLGDGTGAHHLIDPATGRPGPRGTAVVAGLDPVACDVLASCLVLRSGLLDELDAPAARVDADGAIATTVAWGGVSRPTAA